jgi:hypothetical protein
MCLGATLLSIHFLNFIIVSIVATLKKTQTSIINLFQTRSERPNLVPDSNYKYMNIDDLFSKIYSPPNFSLFHISVKMQPKDLQFLP